MNGWQRLFSVFAALILLCSTALWYFAKPSDSKYLVGCDSPTYATQPEAQAALQNKAYAQTSYSSFNCYESLDKVASGREHREDMADWREDFENGAMGILAFLAVIYALGAALGWTWRGFFPKKRPT